MTTTKKKTCSSNILVIEKGVPLPKQRGKYPFAMMEIGDSFLIPKDSHSAATMAGGATGRFKPKRFVSAREGNGRRIWRVE